MLSLYMYSVLHATQTLFSTIRPYGLLTQLRLQLLQQDSKSVFQ